MSVFLTELPSPLGTLTLAGTEEALTGLWMAGQQHFGSTLAGTEAFRGDLPLFLEAKRWLDAYFSGRQPSLADIPLDPRGNEFRRRVWAVLREIPCGSATTYGEIARVLDIPSAQAVGNAVGHNPISILIPCHRVLGAGGNLTGYAGGLERKRFLLNLEGVDISGCK